MMGWILKYIYRAPSLASAAEYINYLLICAIVRMAPLFGGSGESLDLKAFPPAILQAFVSNRWESLMYTSRIISLDR